MNNKALSLFLGGMVLGVGFYFAPTVKAEELPDQNQLKTSITTQAQTNVNTSLTPSTSSTTGNSTGTSAATTPASNDTLVINTGDQAQVDASSNQTSNTEVSNNNESQQQQTVNAEANTGDNSASRNISFGGNAGTINTGNAAVYSALVAGANTNQSGVSGTCATPAGSNANVVNTGNDLELDSSSNAKCTTTVTNGNGAAINQVVNAEANTGHNTADRNIAIGGGTAGMITTGNASTGSLVVAKANSNLLIVGGQSSHGTPGSGASIYILNTGDNLSYDGRRRVNSETLITNNNYAEIAQHADVEANTGYNDASRNINTNGDAGVIKTGDATVYTNASATANHNQTAVTGTTSGASGSTDANITNTGDNLDVDASTHNSNTTSVTNNNAANVDQAVNVVANTGHNTADRNIAFNGDAGSITTGDALVVTALEADANNNTTLVSGSEAGTANGDTNLDVVNTGDDVDVDASNTTNSETTVNNTNEADINQEVNVAANTGNNTASRNIGGSSMTTGNVTVQTELITNANNNYTFVVDSNANGFELFKQFVTAFLGMDWEDLVNSTSTTAGGDTNLDVVNAGNDVNILAENTQTRQVVVNNNNQANVNQVVNVEANTGNNTCNRNIGGCTITTGNAVIKTRLVANVNNNFTFIGNVQLPTPSIPVTPVTPAKPQQPETGVSPVVVEREQPLVLGEMISRQPAGNVLAAVTTLPETGGSNFALFGFVMLAAGLGLKLMKAQA